MNESLIELHQPPFCQCNVIGSPSSVVYNIDCVEGMKQYPDKYFDLAICDPPYGIGDTFIGFSTGAKKGKLERLHKEMDWDNEIPNAEYFIELKRVSKKQIIWGANYFNCFDKEGGALVWYKNRGGNTLSQCEIASVSGQKKVDYVAIQILTGFVSNEERIHPTQKPLKLYEWILNQYAFCNTCKNEGGFYEDIVGDGGSRMYVDCENCDISINGRIKILDTHLGSGNSRIASYFFGCDFVGFETNIDYCQKMDKKFNEAISQQRLF